MNTLCASPSAANLAAAQDAWTEAWSAWNQTRAFRFGPLTDLRVGGDIAFMVDPDKVDAIVAAAIPRSGHRSPRRAWPTLGPTCAGSARSSTSCCFGGTPRRARPRARTPRLRPQLTATTASDIRAAWTDGIDGDPPYADQLAKPGEFFNAQAAVNDLVNGMSMALTEAARELADADAADPGERDGGDTQHGGARVRDTLASVAAVYFGSTSGTKAKGGVGDLVAGVSSSSNERASDFVRRAVASTKGLPDSLNDATTSQLRQSYLKVRNAGTITRAEVASELGVTLSLGDADGDS